MLLKHSVYRNGTDRYSVYVFVVMNGWRHLINHVGFMYKNVYILHSCLLCITPMKLMNVSYYNLSVIDKNHAMTLAPSGTSWNQLKCWKQESVEPSALKRDICLLEEALLTGTGSWKLKMTDLPDHSIHASILMSKQTNTFDILFWSFGFRRSRYDIRESHFPALFSELADFPKSAFYSRKRF